MSWNVVDRHVVMDGVTDNTEALAQIKQDIDELYKAQKPLPRLVFPEGICAFNSWPNLAYPYMNMVAEGQCILKHTGTGDAVVFDGITIAPETGSNKISFENFIVAPNPNSNNGLVLNDIHRSHFKVTATGAGSPQGNNLHAAISMNFCVLTEMHAEVTAWTLPQVPAQTNCIGLYIGRLLESHEAEGFFSTQCLIVNPIMEYCNYGILLSQHTQNTLILNGVCEQCNVGLQMENSAGYNKAINLDLEGNATWDFVAIDKAHSNMLWYGGPPQNKKNNLQGWNNRIVHGALDGVFGH